MKTALTTNTPEQIGSYFSLYRDILSASHYVCKNTGDLIPLTSEKKIIWCWMIDRFLFFKNQDKAFFDNQADIAAACGVSESTVKRFLAELTDAKDGNGKPKGAGYIKTTCTRIGGHKSNSYVLLSDLVLVQPEKAPNKPVQARTEQTNGIAAPAVQNAVERLTEPHSDDSYIPAGQDWAFESIPYDDSEPDWVVATQEDDGSVYDALAFKDGTEIVTKTKHKNDDQSKGVSLPTLDQEDDFSSVFHKDLPSKRFNPNGTVSNEMLHFCAQNNVTVTEENDRPLFVVDGKKYEVGKNGFVPASSGAIKAMEIPLPF